MNCPECDVELIFDDDYLICPSCGKIYNEELR